MSEKHVTVEQWTDLFRHIGLTESDMQAWHAEFETRHPEGHEGFLEWLRIPADRIAEIRRESAAAR